MYKMRAGILPRGDAQSVSCRAPAIYRSLAPARGLTRASRSMVAMSSTVSIKVRTVRAARRSGSLASRSSLRPIMPVKSQSATICEQWPFGLTTPCSADAPASRLGSIRVGGRVEYSAIRAARVTEFFSCGSAPRAGRGRNSGCRIHWVQASRRTQSRAGSVRPRSDGADACRHAQKAC